MIHYGAFFTNTAMNPVEFAHRAEDGGFDSLWGHDHSIHGMDGLGLMGVFAGATREITVGSNVIVMPYRHPSVVASCLSTVAYATNRQLILCAGTGGERLDEYALAGADVHTRGRYTNEALEVITALWQDRPASYHGRWSNFDDVTVSYQPTVTPRIWVGGRSDPAIDRAVRYGVAFNPYMVSPEQLASRYRKVRDRAAAQGRSLDDFTFAVTTFYYPGRDIEDAVERRGGSKLSDVDQRRFRTHNLLGSPDDCLAKLQEYVNAGARHILIGAPPGGQGGTFFQMFEEIRDVARALTPTA